MLRPLPLSSATPPRGSCIRRFLVVVRYRDDVSGGHLPDQVVLLPRKCPNEPGLSCRMGIGRGEAHCMRIYRDFLCHQLCVLAPIWTLRLGVPSIERRREQNATPPQASRASSTARRPRSRPCPLNPEPTPPNGRSSSASIARPCDCSPTKPRPRPSATSICSMAGKRTCCPPSRPQAAPRPP